MIDTATISETVPVWVASQRREVMKRAMRAVTYGARRLLGFNEDEIALLQYVSAQWSSLRVPDPYTWLAGIWYGDPERQSNPYGRDATETRFHFEDNLCENPYLDAFRVAVIKDRLFDSLSYHGAGDRAVWYNRYETLPHLERRRMVDEFAWAIPNDAALHAIAGEGKILEIGSGGGYWAYCLRQIRYPGGSVDITATDPKPAPSTDNTWCKRVEPWTGVELLTAVKAINRYGRDRALLLVWPPIGKASESNYASKAVKTYHRAGGKTVIYVGERGDGCTGSFDETQWNLEREVEIPQWPGIHDGLTIWRRK